LNVFQLSNKFDLIAKFMLVLHSCVYAGTSHIIVGHCRTTIEENSLVAHEFRGYCGAVFVNVDSFYCSVVMVCLANSVG